MINTNLPRGLKYKIDKVRPGIIIPGTDNEPIITISGRGAMIQYRLVTFTLGKYALIEDTYCEGDLDQDELDGIETWISHSMPSLLSESKIRHLIYFLPNSKCYYDFLFQTLYGGDGYKEKKKQRVEFRENTAPIDGNPCSLSVSEIAFIDILTEHPNTPFSADRFFGEDAESTKLTTAKSLDQTWYRFRQYDSSINETFKRERGYFIYRGSPQIWRVDAESETVNLSIEKVFKVICTRDVVATFDEANRQFRSVAVSDISSLELLSFLGLNSDLLDPTLMSTIFDMADFVRVFKRVISRSSYSNEVKGNMMSGGAFRLQSLIERCPRTFNTIHSTSVEDLLNGCAVLEMGSLEPEQKSLVSALTLISILAYLKSTRQSDHRLRNIVLIDEAHALLDQGEGATQEEKALNSTMTQLMINVITEIRAYGVGVIFSDQSPSRVGGRMLDNVDNIISFRLSGEEAEMLREHIGADNNLCDVLPLMSAGEFVLKNRFLRSALPARMDYSPDKEHLKHVSDEQIVKTHTKYLTAHGKDYCPFAFCEKAGCNHCSVAVREEANMFAEQIFAERQLKLSTPEEVAAHIIRIPSVLSFRINTENAAMFRKKCSCIAVHLLRKCSVENGISFGEQTVKKILTDMNNHGKEGNGNE